MTAEPADVFLVGGLGSHAQRRGDSEAGLVGSLHLIVLQGVSHLPEADDAYEPEVGVFVGCKTGRLGLSLDLTEKVGPALGAAGRPVTQLAALPLVGPGSGVINLG